MNTLLRIAMVAAGFALAALPVMRAADEVQPPPPPTPDGPNAAARPDQPGWHGRRMDPAQRLQHLTEALGLTDDQQAKIKAIFKDEAGKRRVIMDDSSLSPDDRRAKMLGLGEEMRTQVRTILTPEQQEKFDAMPRPGRGPRGEGPNREASPPPPAAGNPPPAGGNT